MRCYRLAKRNRLVKRREFQEIYSKGKRYSSGALIAYVLRHQGDYYRVGLTVSKAVGGAVQRNRVKRILRETCRLSQHRLKPGIAVIVAARSGAKGLSSRALSANLLRLFEKSGITVDA